MRNYRENKFEITLYTPLIFFLFQESICDLQTKVKKAEKQDNSFKKTRIREFYPKRLFVVKWELESSTKTWDSRKFLYPLIIYTFIEVEKTNSIFNKAWDPTSSGHLFFVMIYTFCCAFDSFAIPFLWSFSVTKDGLDIRMEWYINMLEWIGYFVIGFYFLDILVKFNVAYFDEIGQMIYDRNKICKKYWKFHNFWFDLLITIPFYLIIDINEEDHPIIKAIIRLLGTLRL